MGSRHILSSGRLLSECREVQRRSLAVRWHVSAWGETEKGIQPWGPMCLIIESPNVSVFPGCFQGLF